MNRKKISGLLLTKWEYTVDEMSQTMCLYNVKTFSSNISLQFIDKVICCWG